LIIDIFFVSFDFVNLLYNYGYNENSHETKETDIDLTLALTSFIPHSKQSFRLKKILPSLKDL